MQQEGTFANCNRDVSGWAKNILYSSCLCDDFLTTSFYAISFNCCEGFYGGSLRAKKLLPQHRPLDEMRGRRRRTPSFLASSSSFFQKQRERDFITLLFCGRARAASAAHKNRKKPIIRRVLITTI